jgi:hypothetical protein
LFQGPEKVNGSHDQAKRMNVSRRIKLLPLLLEDQSATAVNNTTLLHADRWKSPTSSLALNILEENYR